MLQQGEQETGEGERTERDWDVGGYVKVNLLKETKHMKGNKTHKDREEAKGLG